MNKSESKYYNTDCLMNEALIRLLAKKDFEFVTVKEICTTAGVNRSTFYLHYSAMQDLLEETAQYVLKNFYLNMPSQDEFGMGSGENAVKNHIRSAPIEDLYLVSDKYLVPYLQFIKENKRLYGTVIGHAELFKWKDTYNYLYAHLFSPIMDRYSVEESKKEYLVSFFINGIMAIVTKWLSNDCKESIEEIIGIIAVCMNRR